MNKCQQGGVKEIDCGLLFGTYKGLIQLSFPLFVDKYPWVATEMHL